MTEQEMRQTIRDRAFRSTVFLLSGFLGEEDGGNGPSVTDEAPPEDQARVLDCLAKGLAPIREDLCRLAPTPEQCRELVHLLNTTEEACLWRFPTIAPADSVKQAIDGARFLATAGQPGPVVNAGSTFLGAYCKALASVLWFETHLARYVDSAKRAIQTPTGTATTASISGSPHPVVC